MRYVRTLTLNGVHLRDDAMTLLEAVEARTNVPREAMWLEFAGKPLGVGQSLASCGLRSGSTVHLAVRGRGGGCCNCKEGGLLEEKSFMTLPEYASDGRSGQAGRDVQEQADVETDDPVRTLSKLDEEQLVPVLQQGDIRLLRPSWLLQPSTMRISWRQDLEALERQGESPLLSPAEAVALIKQGNRCVGALT